MKLDEAIQHCEEVAISKTKQVENGDWEKGSSTERDCIACAEEHRQLAEWLKELKAYKEQSDDAISRREALNAITMAEVRWQAVDNVNKLPSVSPQQRTGRWISVSERLPEDRQSVLVWCPQYKNIYCAYLEKEQWWIFGAFVQIVPNEVIAWMPLPEPYKAESEDKE